MATLTDAQKNVLEQHLVPQRRSEWCPSFRPKSDCSYRSTGAKNWGREGRRSSLRL